MKRISHIVSMLAAVILSVACSVAEDRGEVGVHAQPKVGTLPISLTPTGYVPQSDEDAHRTSTRAYSSGDAEYEPLPDNYTIFMSSYYMDSQDRSADCDYFTSIPFSKTSGQDSWHGTPAQFWPLTGTLDFLAIAGDVTPETGYPELPDKLTWGNRRNTDGVRIDLSGFDGSTEILYATATPAGGDRAPLDLKFHHTMAQLEFLIKSELTDLVRLDSIVINNVANGGYLTIETYPFFTYSWDTGEATVTDKTVPGSKPEASGDAIELTTEYQTKPFSIAIQPQSRQNFQIHLFMRTNTSHDWEKNAVPQVFDYTSDVAWKSGTRYKYNINVTGFQTISVTAASEPWDTASEDDWNL